MDRIRRRALGGMVAALSGLLTQVVAAEQYPSRPIKLVVPYGPGSITDVYARQLADHLGRVFGQQVVVDNRPGASGTIGLAMGARAKPDGYTIVWGTTSNMALSPALGVPVEYDPLRSFQPVVLFGATPMVLVAHPSLQVRDLRQLVSLARAKPGALSYASPGATTTAHVAGEVLQLRLGIKLTHVPYKSSAASLMGVLANEVQLAIDFPETSGVHVKAGKLQALLVTTRQRVALLPNAASTVEGGIPDLDMTAWGGLLAPAGAPKELVLRVNAETNNFLQLQEVREQLAKSGSRAGGGTPEQFGSFIQTELRRWKEFIEATGIKAA